MEANPQLAAFAYGLGIVALLWVFRRTLLRLARAKGDPDEQSYGLRKRAAILAIDSISAREWLRTYRRAQRIERRALALTAAEEQALARISAWQASAGGRAD